MESWCFVKRSVYGYKEIVKFCIELVSVMITEIFYGKMDRFSFVMAGWAIGLISAVATIMCTTPLVSFKSIFGEGTVLCIAFGVPVFTSIIMYPLVNAFYDCYVDEDKKKIKED